MKKRTLLGLLAVLPLTLLTACGGKDSNDANIRLVNASPGYASLDLYVADNLESSDVAFGTVSSATGVSNGNVITALTLSGSTTELLTQSRSLESGKNYSVIAYGWEGALKSAVISDDETEADTGKTKVSVLNTASDAGSLDVYLTGEGEDLASATPVAAVDGGSRSSFAAVSSGTYRLRITAKDDPTDLRLDVSGVAITSKGVVTFIITPTTGGVLVNSLMLAQGGSVAQQLTTKARARVVAAMAGGSSVTLTAGATALATSYASPRISPYVMVDAGTLAVNTAIDGNSLAAQDIAFAAGSDTTLIVSGAGLGDASVSIVRDDNRLPTTTGKYKIRLMHASPALSNDALSLSVNLSPVVDNQAYKSASTFRLLTATTAADIEVSSLSLLDPVVSLLDQETISKGIYTLFVYDLANGTTTGKLIKER
jgi:hypothetical protein